MFYIGGVVAGSGQVTYTISDMDLPWVIRQTCMPGRRPGPGTGTPPGSWRP